MPLFDPREGMTVAEPLGSGPGWWAGAPSITYDQAQSRYLLYYRLRKPRELGRGAECRIAASTDGVHFETVWSMTKEQLGTVSMEKACLLRCLDGLWRLYISYVDPVDSKWRTDVLEAATPEHFSPEVRRTVFTAQQIGAEGVKDPWVCIVGRMYYMLLSYAPTPQALKEADRQRMHATGDVYNTGITKSVTGLATSTDGVAFEWRGMIMDVGKGWDKYCSRLSSFIYRPPVFVGFYDGSTSVEENYE